VGKNVQLAAIALLLGACYAPDYQENLPCTESGECPGDLQCVADLCVSSASSPTADGGGGSDAAQDAIDAGADAGSDAAPCLAGSMTIEASASIVDFVVPECITSLTIEVFGAEGGGSPGAALLGGKGARMKGDFAVTSGEVLKVLVGGKGADAVPINNVFGEQGGGTGGGGSFVVGPDGAAMIVAGGGGGAIHNAVVNLYLIPGGDAPVTSDGIAGDGGGAGGIAGAGGVTYDNTGYHGGTGAGGFLSGGVNNSVGNVGNFGTPNAPGSSYAMGGAGGIAGSKGRNGGFGGGGSAGYTGGGGGGYSGGGAGGTPVSAVYGGGGGGSLNLGTSQDNSPGVKTGDGQVVIDWQPPL
jgi:hypothetical protein